MRSRLFIKIILAIVCIVAIISMENPVQAKTGAELIQQMEGQATSFLTLGSQNATNIKYSKVTDPFVGLGQILTMVGAGVLVAVTAYMGIKYLTSGPEAQAKLKVQLIGIVVSGMVIFGAYKIWSTVIHVAEKF